ncbi:hypothetical protein FKM82_031200 [Ascaphus truei]
MLITFDEVAVYFSQGEWEYLEEGQKELYKNVMTENYQTLHSLGWVNMKPVIISVIEQGEEPCIRCHRNTKTVDNSIVRLCVTLTKEKSTLRNVQWRIQINSVLMENN